MKTRTDSYLQVGLFALAATIIGWGIQAPFSSGIPHPLLAMTLAVAVCAAGLLLPGIQAFALPWPQTILRLFFAGALAFQFSTHLIQPPGAYLRVSQDDLIFHHQLIALAAVLSGVLLSATGRLRALAFLGILALFFALGLWMLRHSPSPAIDVFHWHSTAYEALRAGENPYAITLPNIYGHTRWYGPGLADATHVFVGYPYPPLELALGAPGHLLMGDYRYSYLVLLTAAASLFGFWQKSWHGTAAAALFLFCPRMFFVLEQGWTESTGIFVLALVVFCAYRAPKFLPWAFGLLLSIKQYFILALPLVLLLQPVARREDLKPLAVFLLKAGGLALAINLPFFLWNPRAFIDSVVIFQGKQPFRPDAISWMAATAVGGVPQIPNWLGFALVPVAWGVALLGKPTPARFAAAVSFLLLLFFVVAKQAFVNYYFFALGSLALACAACLPAASELDARADSPLLKPPS